LDNETLTKFVTLKKEHSMNAPFFIVQT